MNLLLIRDDDGNEYDLESWTAHCRQLGRCECGQHGEKRKVCNLYFHEYGKEIDAYRCKTCGKLFDIEGTEIDLTPAWQTINPGDLSVAPFYPPTPYNPTLDWKVGT